MRKLTLHFCLLFLFPNVVSGEIVEIYLLNQIDDNRGFCIDMRGHKSKAKTTKELQAHTCYSYQGEVAVDQGFSSLKFSENQFYLPAFNVCMEAVSLTVSGSLKVRKCQIGQLQKFEWDNEGRINIVNNLKLCLTVSQGASRQGRGGSPVHLIRNLSMELCSDVLKPFQVWGIRQIE